MNSTLKKLLLSAAAGALILGFGANSARAASAISLASLAGSYVYTGSDSEFDMDNVVHILGESTFDTSGNSCGTIVTSPDFTFTVVSELFPPAPPYNPNTGTGTADVSIFLGGSCAGSLFLPDSSILVDAQLMLFIASKGGSHIDSIIVADKNVPAAVGAFSSNKR